MLVPDSRDDRSVRQRLLAPAGFRRPDTVADALHREIRLGWWIGPRHRRAGYAGEAVAALVAAIHDAGFATVEIGTAESLRRWVVDTWVHTPAAYQGPVRPRLEHQKAGSRMARSHGLHHGPGLPLRPPIRGQHLRIDRGGERDRVPRYRRTQQQPCGFDLSQHEVTRPGFLVDEPADLPRPQSARDKQDAYDEHHP
ncbi:GNAT family N-acetyltransferase [Nocardia farcinica]